MCHAKHQGLLCGVSLLTLLTAGGLTPAAPQRPRSRAIVSLSGGRRFAPAAGLPSLPRQASQIDLFVSRDGAWTSRAAKARYLLLYRALPSRCSRSGWAAGHPASRHAEVPSDQPELSPPRKLGLVDNEKNAARLSVARADC